MLRSINPDWDYRLYSDADIVNFIAKHYPKTILESYYRIESSYGAARADLFRYLLMYKCGGVYLDIKSSATLPFNTVLKPDDVFLLSNWQNYWGGPFECAGLHRELRGITRGEYQQWFIIAAPGHPFLKAVIDRVLSNIDRYSPIRHGVGRFAVWRTTGPIAYTLAIQSVIHLHPHRLVDSASQLGLVYDIVDREVPQTGFLRRHYSEQNIPLIRSTGVRSAMLRCLWPLFRGFHMVRNECNYRQAVRWSKRLPRS
jgi:inositol phosphorylceramide mannosyltransferase catalytic subunit